MLRMEDVYTDDYDFKVSMGDRAMGAFKMAAAGTAAALLVIGLVALVVSLATFDPLSGALVGGVVGYCGAGPASESIGKLWGKGLDQFRFGTPSF